MIPFGLFAPSQASTTPGTIDVAEGVFPLAAQDWRPFPTFTAYADALGSTPVGANQIQDPDGIEYTYAATGTGLFRIDTSADPYSWTNVTGSLSFTLNGEFPVTFLAFGNKVLAVGNGLGAVGIADIGSGNFSALADAPESSYGAVFADRVWLLNQTNNPNRVEWSAPNDQTVWGDYTRGADFQVLEEGGAVTGSAIVGNTLYVFQEDAVQAFVQDPGPLLFQRQTIRSQFGAPSAQSIVQGPGGAYFISEDGFYVVSSAGVQNIGAGTVDEWFFDTQADLDKLWAIQGAHDPANKFILWRYGTPGFAGAGHTNKVVGYAYNLNRWFGFSVPSAWLLRAASPGLLLDGLTGLVDESTQSIDSRTWSGGRPQLAGFDSSFRFGFFDGAAMATTIETADFQLTPGERTRLNGFRPVIEGTSNYTGQFGTKAKPADLISFKTAATPNSAGIITQRANGLYNKCRLNVPAGEAWSALSGIELIQPRRAGMR